MDGNIINLDRVELTTVKPIDLPKDCDWSGEPLNRGDIIVDIDSEVHYNSAKFDIHSLDAMVHKLRTFDPDRINYSCRLSRDGLVKYWTYGRFSYITSDVKCSVCNDEIHKPRNGLFIIKSSSVYIHLECIDTLTNELETVWANSDKILIEKFNHK